MRRLEILLAVFLAGCASTNAGWEAGVTRATDRELPAIVASDVRVSFKKEFGAFELEKEKLPVACHSTTLLRRMGLLDSRDDAGTSFAAVVLGELTTEEFPRDNERSRLKGREYKRVFGIGGDEWDLFETYPSPRSIEKGVQRLKEMAAAIGANEVRDIYFTGYAEHQMWEGDVVSFTPTSTDSPIYTSIQLLEFRLRDVRFHGTAISAGTVIHK